MSGCGTWLPGQRTATLAQGTPGLRQQCRVQPGREDPGAARRKRSRRAVGRGHRTAGRHPGPSTRNSSPAVSRSARTGRPSPSASNAHIELWNVATRQQSPPWHKTASQPSPASIAFSPDGKTLAVGYDGGHVGLWNVAAGPADRHLGPRQPGSQCRVQPGREDPGRPGYQRRYVGLWDVARRATATLAGASSVTSVAFHGQILVTGDSRGTLPSGTRPPRSRSPT